MIDMGVFFTELANHVSSLRSAPIVCHEYTSFESWFRVEIVPVFWKMCFSKSTIVFNYNYPGSRSKADLCVKTAQEDIVIELKSFVVNQDSNKKYEYPGQIARLAQLVNAGNAIQVIAMTTFIGYSQIQLQNLMNKFFQNPWRTLGPQRLIPQYDLHVALASIPLHQGARQCPAGGEG